MQINHQWLNCLIFRIFLKLQNSYQDPLFYRPCMVGVCMMLSQQLSGINAIMFYSTKIFLAAGLDEPKKGTVFVGIINVIFSGVCVVLIERFGRKVSCKSLNSDILMRFNFRHYI